MMDGYANPPRLHGAAKLVRKAFHGESLSPLWDELLDRANRDPGDAAAFCDLATILQTRKDPDTARDALQAALVTTRTFEVTCGDGSGLTVLALVTPGDLMANTPIEFLLEHTNARLLLHYVDATTTSLGGLPQHDVAFLAIGESDESRAVLERTDMLLAGWPGHVVNGDARRIMALSRDGVSRTLAGAPNLLAPATARVSRPLLEAVALDRAVLGDLIGGADYPIIARPIGTHAGKGLEKLATATKLREYLRENAEADMFFVAPWIDYASADGLFRKQRIAFIEGEPFASHMAVSEHWIVHYLSAGMMRRPERRAEEAQWMATFETDFARRHRRAFSALVDAVALDYFAIDCAEMPDGRLLVFEADVAMIVHGMDSARTFPYKVDAMGKVFARFETMLRGRSRSGSTAGMA